MAADEQGVPVLDTPMNDGQTPESDKGDEAKTTYRSFKKKYRKMRAVFDVSMRDSDALYMMEQQAQATIKRLAQMNSQTLDLLLDINDSAQIPADKRFDLLTETATLPAIPSFIDSADLTQASELNTPEGKAVYSAVRAIIDEKEAKQAASKPPKSLGQLMAKIPHLHTRHPEIPHDVVNQKFRQEEGPDAPLRYLSMNQMDEYLYEIDSIFTNTPPIPTPNVPLSYQDLTLRNPHSVYNWLRQHHPKIFLQDGEGSEKSSGKPGALRGAGKRNSIPAPSIPNTLEFVEEDGTGYEPALAQQTSTKNKRKRGDGDDDGGYHPKSGHVADGKGKKPKQSRKKKSDESNSSGSAVVKKARGKKGAAAAASASSPPPAGAHPFGGA